MIDRLPRRFAGRPLREPFDDLIDLSENFKLGDVRHTAKKSKVLSPRSKVEFWGRLLAGRPWRLGDSRS